MMYSKVKNIGAGSLASSCIIVGWFKGLRFDQQSTSLSTYIVFSNEEEVITLIGAKMIFPCWQFYLFAYDAISFSLPSQEI